MQTSMLGSKATPLSASTKLAIVRHVVPRVSTSTQATAQATAVQTLRLGKSSLEIPEIGIGAWSWGDRSGYWGFPNDESINDNRSAFNALLDSGLTFIDTAEVYGFGKSEELIGEFSKASSKKPIVASKFAPLPWRFSADNVEAALRDTLSRLQTNKIDLYQIHWPGFPFINNGSTDSFVEGMANVQRKGMAEAVAVCNFNAKRLRRSHSIMQGQGVPLASNQVQYSLLYREPETNGVLDTCKELGITLMAYSPLCQGLLTGKYTPSNLPSGARSSLINKERVEAVEPLIKLMKEIGQANGGKSCAQVAINWTLCKGTFPIPGARNQAQAKELAGATGWRLSADQVDALDKESDKVNVSAQGAPFEEW